MKILTVIPARGGSKGVPGKNARLVYGKPLIEWTIECAAAVPGLDRIIVSSDDAAILEIAARNNRATPRKRPAALAGDSTPITDVIFHLLGEEEASGDRFDAVLLLQPTAPLREPRHVIEALERLTPGVNSVISVCEMRDTHPARMYAMGEGELLLPLQPEFETARRQDIPPAYYRSGSIYLVRREAFESARSVMAKPARGYVVDHRYLLNIDEPRDMLIAEALVTAWQTGTL